MRTTLTLELLGNEYDADIEYDATPGYPATRIDPGVGPQVEDITAVHVLGNERMVDILPIIQSDDLDDLTERVADAYLDELRGAYEDHCEREGDRMRDGDL